MPAANAMALMRSKNAMQETIMQISLLFVFELLTNQVRCCPDFFAT
jgi:hypothetical protein